MRLWKRSKQPARSPHPYHLARDRQPTLLKPLFVEAIPQLPEMEQDTLYVSMRFATLSHLCPCGCGRLVDVTLSPTTRTLTYDGEHLTLRPSIGVKFSCRSHYSIVRNAIVWHPPISASETSWYRRVWERWS